MEMVINRAIFALVLALSFSACHRAITERFQVSGWNLGDSTHKNIQFLINGSPVGPVVKSGQSSAPFEVDVIVGQSMYGTGTSPSNITSTNVVLGVKDVDSNTIFMTTQNCYLTKYQVTNFMYERRFGTDSLYCR